MSFRCDLCNKPAATGVPLTRQIVERREVEYKDAEGEVIGKGWEIVKEIHVCPRCVAGPAADVVEKPKRKRTVRVKKATSVVQVPEIEVEDKPSRARRRKKAA